MKSLKDYTKQAMIALSLLTIGSQFVPAIGTDVIVARATETESGDAADINGINIAFDENGNLQLGGISSGKDTDAWNKFLLKYKNFIVGVTATATASMLLFLVWGFVRLGTSAHSGGDRAKATQGLIWLAIATAGLGAVTFFFAFFLNALR